MRQQSAEWLAEDRLKVYGITLTIIQLVGLVVMLVLSAHSPRPDSGFPVGVDFRVFCAASHLALEGDPSGAYDPGKMFATLQSIDPSLLERTAGHGWFYPPTYLLAMLPFASAPWWVAYMVFTGGTFAAFFALTRKIAAPSFRWWLIAGFPPVLTTLVLGQNSFLTATLAGAALLLLDRRPILAGICIGLLAIKPHLAILFPLALIVSGRWRVFWAAALTTTTFVIAATLILGVESGQSFVHGLKAARAAVAEPYWPRILMPTLYAGAVNLGASETVANVLQALIAAGAMAFVAWIWRKDAPTEIRNSALILGTLLVSPHLFTYDLTWLALPIVWMWREGLSTGWLAGERSLLAFAWVAPLPLAVVAQILDANPTPLLEVALAGFVVARARQAHRSATLNPVQDQAA